MGVVSDGKLELRRTANDYGTSAFIRVDRRFHMALAVGSVYYLRPESHARVNRPRSSKSTTPSAAM